ncbi:MAG: hypothetical protein KJO43_00970 [Phycisphaerae bacterium]|nr:hypothetical protein [Phycisphaerae bacterium]
MLNRTNVATAVRHAFRIERRPDLPPPPIPSPVWTTPVATEIFCRDCGASLRRTQSVCAACARRFDPTAPESYRVAPAPLVPLANAFTAGVVLGWMLLITPHLLNPRALDEPAALLAFVIGQGLPLAIFVGLVCVVASGVVGEMRFERAQRNNRRANCNADTHDRGR